MARGLAVTIIICFLLEFSESETSKTKKTKPPFVTQTSRLYDPNYGFKQYWPGGDWKYLGKTLNPTTPSKVPTTTTLTTTKAPQVCGDDCPETYRKYGSMPWYLPSMRVFCNEITPGGSTVTMEEVCVLPSDAKNATHMDQYETMTYCEFLLKSNPRCTYSDWRDIKYVFVHVGKCLQNYVQQWPTPEPVTIDEKNPTDIFNKSHPDWFTPDVFEMGPKRRISKFVNKFYDPIEWKKFYSDPLPEKRKPFENLD